MAIPARPRQVENFIRTGEAPQEGDRERIQVMMLKSKKRRLERLLLAIQTHTDKKILKNEMLDEAIDLWIADKEVMLSKLRGRDNGT